MQRALVLQCGTRSGRLGVKVGHGGRCCHEWPPKVTQRALVLQCGTRMSQMRVTAPRLALAKMTVFDRVGRKVREWPREWPRVTKCHFVKSDLRVFPRSCERVRKHLRGDARGAVACRGCFDPFVWCLFEGGACLGWSRRCARVVRRARGSRARVRK